MRVVYPEVKLFTVLGVELTVRSSSKVMFFLPYLGGGGAEMNAARVAQGLLEHGISPSFAVCRDYGSYESLLSPTIPIHRLQTGHVESSTLRLMRSVRLLRKLISRLQPDILCPVMDHSAIAALRAVSRLANKPKVILCIQVSPYSQYASSRALIARIKTRLVKKYYPSADHVIALSGGVAEEIVSLVPELAGRVSVVPNAGGVSTSSSTPVTEVGLQGPKNGKLIVACGRLAEQKGYPYLLRAFARVVQNEQANLWILGEGPLKTNLVRLAESLGISGHVEFLGFRDNPGAYMKVADVFVLSSLWEGFGNVIVEAMGEGTPVVSTDCPHGPGEIIENGRNGLLVPPADEKALADALLRVLNDEKLRASLAEAALIRAKDFSPDQITAQYAAVFDKVLSQSQHSPGLKVAS